MFPLHVPTALFDDMGIADCSRQDDVQSLPPILAVAILYLGLGNPRPQVILASVEDQDARVSGCQAFLVCRHIQRGPDVLIEHLNPKSVGSPLAPRSSA